MRYICGRTSGIGISEDGTTWQPLSAPSGESVYLTFRAGGKFHFVKTLSSGVAVLYSSATGDAPLSAWTQVELPRPDGVTEFIYRFLEDGGTWVLLNIYGYILISTDQGATWAARYYGIVPYGFFGYGITKSAGEYHIFGSGFQVYSSPDLVTWTRRDMGGTSFSTNITDATTDGSRLFAVTETGQIWSGTTVEGMTLEKTYSGVNLRRITYQNGKVICSGANLIAARSVRLGLGVWSSAAPLAVSSWINDVIWDAEQSRYMACSQGGPIVASRDLKTWTTIYDGAFSSFSLAAANDNTPPFQLFGAAFQGFERGLSCTVKRQILVDDSMGGSVVLTPVAPAAFDEWAIEAELWVSAAQAQALEAIVPPRGVPLENAIRLPPRGGEASFPGLLPFAQATGYDQYATPMVTAFESLGRKAPGVDLFGYRIALSFFAEADGLALNGSPTPTTTPPAWLVGKFTAHQIQDWSSQGEVVAATTLAGHPSPRGSFYPIKHGRRRDVNFNLDHLSTDRANELVALFRGVRHNPVTVNMDRGSEGIAPTSVYLVDLSLQRGAGLWWDGTLKAVLA